MTALDINETQVAIDFDDSAFPWHWRCLVSRLGESSSWVGFTPDPDFYFMGLNEGRHPAFTGTGPFPVNIRDHVYAFDPVSVVGFRRFERDGRRWAQLLGEGDEADVEDEVWVIAEF